MLCGLPRGPWLPAVLADVCCGRRDRRVDDVVEHLHKFEPAPERPRLIGAAARASSRRRSADLELDAYRDNVIVAGSHGAIVRQAIVIRIGPGGPIFWKARRGPRKAVMLVVSGGRRVTVEE